MTVETDKSVYVCKDGGELMTDGRIKVIGEDRMCFWVDAKTLEPLGCGSFDTWAFSDPEKVPTMHANEWSAQRYARWIKSRDHEAVTAEEGMKE